MPILNPTQEPFPALGFYDPRLYKDRSEGRKKKVKRDKSKLEMDESTPDSC